THTCVACSTDGVPSCPDPDRPACQRSGALRGACTECSASNAALCGGVKPVCVPDLGVCGCAGPSDDPSCRAADSGLTCSRDCGGAPFGRVCDATTSGCVPGCRGTGGNGCPSEQVCSSMTDAIGRCDVAPATDGGADGRTDGGDGSTDGGAPDADGGGSIDGA